MKVRFVILNDFVVTSYFRGKKKGEVGIAIKDFCNPSNQIYLFRCDNHHLSYGGFF